MDQCVGQQEGLTDRLLERAKRAAGGNRTCGAASWEEAWWSSTDCHQGDWWLSQLYHCWNCACINSVASYVFIHEMFYRCLYVHACILYFHMYTLVLIIVIVEHFIFSLWLFSVQFASTPCKTSIFFKMNSLYIFKMNLLILVNTSEAYDRYAAKTQPTHFCLLSNLQRWSDWPPL